LYTGPNAIDAQELTHARRRALLSMSTRLDRGRQLMGGEIYLALFD